MAEPAESPPNSSNGMRFKELTRLGGHGAGRKRVLGNVGIRLWHGGCFMCGGQGAVQETNDPTLKLKDVWRST